MRRVNRSRILSSAVIASACVVIAGCTPLHLTKPAGSGKLRYRDAIFTQVDTTTDITFGQAADLTGTMKTLKLDMYQPKDDTVTKRAAIVWVHGGSFKTGARTSPEIVDEANTFAKEGYVNVSIDYRLSENGCVPFGAECIDAIAMAEHDAQAAVRFLRANAATYDIDVNRIAVAGTSAGAITAYNVAYGSEIPGHSGNPGFSSKVSAAVSLSGAAINTDPAPGDPPTMDFHGTADDLVPFSWSTATLKNAHDDHLIAEQTVWQGDGHVPYTKHRQQILDETRNFLYAAMNLSKAAH